LSNFFVFGEEAGFDDLQKVVAHIILFNHLLYNIVDLRVESLEKRFDICELSFDSFDENMGEVFVIIGEECKCLFHS
jgi:hypothetical protein